MSDNPQRKVPVGQRTMPPFLTVYVILIWPPAAIYLALWLLLMISIVAWLWNIVLPPISLDWLAPLMENFVDEGWWTLASTRIVGQSAWVMPSALATTIGVCAAIYALPNPDRSIYRQLAWVAILIASGASLWMWLAFPSTFLSENQDPVPWIATAVVAALISLLAGLTGGFIRSKEVRIELLRDRSNSLSERLEWMAKQGWRLHRPNPLIRLSLAAVVPALTITLIQVPIFLVANQGGMGTFFSINIIIAVTSAALGLVMSWPFYVRFRLGTLLLQFVRLVVLVASVIVPLLLGTKMAGLGTLGIPVLLLSATYVAWSAFIVLTHSPWGVDLLTRLLLGRSASGQRARRAGLVHWSLAVSVRETRLVLDKITVSALNQRINELDPPESAPEPEPTKSLLGFFGLVRSYFQQ